MPTTGFGGDLGRLGGDKLPLLQSADALAHRVLTHAYRMANRFDAVPALMRLSIFAPFQETVDRQFSIVQSQLKQLVGQKENVSVISILHVPPPV